MALGTERKQQSQHTGKRREAGQGPGEPRGLVSQSPGELGRVWEPGRRAVVGLELRSGTHVPRVRGLTRLPHE